MKLSLLTSLLLSLTFANTSIAQVCNPNIEADAPDKRYILRADGTAIDKRTGLTWMRCAMGQTWDGSVCAGSPKTYSWKYALEVAENSVFAGQSNWRLPNQKELQSLIENRCFNPAINLTIFPNAGNYSYWSSSPSSVSDSLALSVDFSDGAEHSLFKSSDSDYAVRLVRGGL